MIKTTPPENVKEELDSLLKKYDALEKVQFKDIIDFHVQFERIHPFGDGTGRVGRMLMYKECLRNGIMPFVVLDKDKAFYLRGLKEYTSQPNYLIETCLQERDVYASVCSQLLNF